MPRHIVPATVEALATGLPRRRLGRSVVHWISIRLTHEFVGGISQRRLIGERAIEDGDDKRVRHLFETGSLDSAREVLAHLGGVHQTGLISAVAT